MSFKDEDMAKRIKVSLHPLTTNQASKKWITRFRIKER